MNSQQPYNNQRRSNGYQDTRRYPFQGGNSQTMPREEPHNSYYSSRPQNNNQQREGGFGQGGNNIYQHKEKAFETILQPNEMRISTGGDLQAYSRVALSILHEQGYNNVKMVGRGRAVSLTQDIVDFLKQRKSDLNFQVRFTTAFNKRGDVVDEVHVMLSKKSAEEIRNEKPAHFQSERPNNYQRGTRYNSTYFHSIFHIFLSIYLMISGLLTYFSLYREPKL